MECRTTGMKWMTSPISEHLSHSLLWSWLSAESKMGSILPNEKKRILIVFLNEILEASTGHTKNIHYSWSYDIQNQISYLFTVVTTELYTRGKLQSSVDSFHCQHLYIWFAGISKVCVCLHKFIVLLLYKTLWSIMLACGLFCRRYRNQSTATQLPNSATYW